MRKILLLSATAISLMTLLVIHSCKKTTDDGIVQPITIVKPDTLLLYANAGSTQQINIQFVTDRPIDYVLGRYRIDSVDNLNNPTTFPDTLFYTILDTIATKLSNKYTYSGVYQIPDTLKPLNIVKFDIKMKASGNPSNPDTLYYEKQFKISIL